MRPRTLIGLMFCTLFLSAPAFAQPSTAQPVIQTAQAAQNDVTIPEGITQEFDAAKGEIKFDGVLTNKGTIIIKSSDPAQAEAILRAGKVVNEGKIISQIPTLTINTESVFGAGEVTAPETVAITAIGKDLLIANGTYRAKYFRPSAEGKLRVNARRIDAQIDLKAYELSIGVREGNLDIVKQKVDGDPIYYNRGGDITAVMPGNGFDIYVLAAGNITLSGVNAIGLNGEVRDFVAFAGLHFANPVDDGNSEFGCGGFAGVSCAQTIQNNSGPGQIFEGAPGGPFPPSGTITINGAIAKDISLSARDIVINGTLDARQDNRPGGPSIILDAANSITVNATLKTEATTDQSKYGSVALQAPTINVNSKITSDSVFIAAFENSVATTGSITTAAIEARTSEIYINAGHIQFEEVGGALLPSALPHDSGEFTIKTGKLTAHRYVMLSATGNIDAGNIELLPNEAPVPLGAHDVRIHANVGKEDAPPLKIGGGTNGAASITVQGTTDLGPGLTQKTGTIFLTNGPSGDIVLDGAKIHVTNEHDGTPSLIAYAGTGQVTVKGNIVLDGTATAPAGQILLVGDEIRSTGATISVKDTLADAFERPAKVVLSTSKLTLAGDLTIEANSKALTSIRIVPKGSITLDPQEHFEGLPHFVDKFPVNVTEDQVLVAGAGNLTVKAKSDDAKVEITAKLLKFNNGTSQIFATGDGSQINIDYPGAASGVNSLIFSGGAVTFNTDNNQSHAGTINITADGVKGNEGSALNLLARGQATFNGGHVTVNAAKVTLEDSSSVIDASSIGTSGEGGVINLTTTGNLTVAGSLTSNGKDAGKGGNILVQSAQNADLTMASISASGGCNSGDGGEVSISADNNISVGGAAAAEGGGTCATLNQQTGLLPLAPGDGNGGTITITGRISGDFFTGPLTGLSVDAKSGDGNGGTITIHNTNAVDISHLVGPGAITARGIGNGKGGKVVIDKVDKEPSSISISRVIAVSGGDGLLSAEDNDFGSIELNGITCQQRTTGENLWPKAYWNCISTESNATQRRMPRAAIKLHTTMRTNLGTQNVEIYLMRNIDVFKKFHKVAGPADTEGVRGWSEITLKVSAAFKDELYASGNFDASPFYSGTIIHELGHQLDENVWSDASINNAAWLAANQTATTAFDAPGLPPPAPNNCPAVVDADRTDPSVQLNAICSLFDGVPAGEIFKTNSQGLHDYGGGWMLSKRERFTRAFANAYQRKYPTDIFLDEYQKFVDGRLQAERNYMDLMIVNGQP